MSSSQRLTTRQADAQDRRTRMTQRRQQLSHKIRKQKKSEYLARKRNLPYNANKILAVSDPVATMASVLQIYCENPTAESLRVLQATLQSTNLVGSEENPLVFLSQENQSKAVSLLENLRKHSASTDDLQIILQILVRLTAISYTQSSSYYGCLPSSWCSLLAQDSQWLSILVSLVPREETLIIIGNLVGEGSSQVCPALRAAGMIPALVSAINQPAAAWALTNAIRNDTATWASVYCNEKFLNPGLLEQLLQQPLIATQTAWMIASLTSREAAVVQYLVGHPSFSQTLVRCLEQPISQNQTVPLVQALGNIATYEEFVARLLSLPSFLPLLGQLLFQNHTNSGSREVMVHTAWLAGCLLCDAGLSSHPSTTSAAPSLMPILFQLLGDNPETLSLEVKREIVCALRNALALPPAASADPSVSTVPVPLPWKDQVRGSLSSIVKLISSFDSDAVLAALYVVDLLLRRDQSLQTALEEEDIEAALESVCDSALEEANEIAANLLDDFFYNDDEEEEYPPMGLVEATPTRSGMGRGRGATLPSWMTQN